MPKRKRHHLHRPQWQRQVQQGRRHGFLLGLLLQRDSILLWFFSTSGRRGKIILTRPQVSNTDTTQVSIHFRGPIAIKQFAVYYPAASSSTTSSAPAATHTGGNSLGLKRAKRANPAERRHPHGHAHFHDSKKVREIQDAEVERRQLGAMVTAVIDGKTVSWANNWDGQAHQATPSAGGAKASSVVVAKGSSAAASVATSAAAPVVASSAAVKASSKAAAASSSSSAAAVASSVPLASGDWSRAGYYNSAQGVSQGLSFLNHLGGGSSGVFD